jgi:nucleoside 2-deoxyribosyltransferase
MLKKVAVYLAGGMKSGWQDDVKRILERPNLVTFDPREYNDPEAGPDNYVWNDIFRIRAADIIFGYMEKDNPHGYNLMWELGFATAHDHKQVIFVDETERRTEMAQETTRFYTNLDAGVKALVNLVEMMQNG